MSLIENNNQDSNIDHNLMELQKMLFIYNAVTDGWTVRMLEDGRFEFQKERKKITSDVCMDSFLEKFLKYYMRLDNRKL